MRSKRAPRHLQLDAYLQGWGLQYSLRAFTAGRASPKADPSGGPSFSSSRHVLAKSAALTQRSLSLVALSRPTENHSAH